MKKSRIQLLGLILVPPIVGMGTAVAAVAVNSSFFGLLPILTFAFGYFTRNKVGLLIGAILFLSYTVTVSFYHNPPSSSIGLRFTLPFDLGVNFITGGFILLILGGLAAGIRKNGIRSTCSYLVVALLIVTTGYCVWRTLERCEVSYVAEIRSPSMEYLSSVYLPLLSTIQDPDLDLHQYQIRPADYTPAIVDTERGKMLSLGNVSLVDSERLVIEYKLQGTSCRGVELLPKEITAKYDEGMIKEAFIAPVWIDATDTVPVTIMVSVAVRAETNVNFYNFKSTYYADRIDFQGEITGEQWVLAEGQSGMLGKTRITGASGY